MILRFAAGETVAFCGPVVYIPDVKNRRIKAEQ
jgi:hypothetical protein